MATYYPNSSDQRHIMPALYMREPGPTSYPNSSSLQNEMAYLSYSSGSLYSTNMDSNSQSQLNCVEVLAQNVLSQDPSQGPPDLLQSHSGMFPNLTCGVWRDGRSEMLFMQPVVTEQAMEEDMSTTKDSHMDISTRLGIVNGGSDISSVHGQVLSLSLGTQIPPAGPLPSFQFPSGTTDISFVGSHQPALGGSDDSDANNIQQANHGFLPRYSDEGMKGELLNGEGSAVSKFAYPVPDMLSGLASTIQNSKYLIAAQQLLDDVVNVKKALKRGTEKHQNSIPAGVAATRKADEGSGSAAVFVSSPIKSLNQQEVLSNSSNDLSSAERHELQNKLTKLLTMLDEVDQRYKQYYHQMQIVMASFDVIAGSGSAKPYTALALQTISRHFRCMRDAVKGQIQLTRNKLGEQEGSNGKGNGVISRLRFVDHHHRQQRALQQIGMVHQHAWRPQRGLPENSVSILRAWLFEHFLHPYPKDSDKIMLARQTGLTRSQVSNWFINARVRLWKPMVEEMYKEEIGDTEMDSNSSSEGLSRPGEEIQTSEDKEDLQGIRPWHDKTLVSAYDDAKSDNISDIGQKPEVEDCCFVPETLVHPDENERFVGMGYHMADLGRYDSDGVSLTLGLQHCVSEALPLSGEQQDFITMRSDGMFGSSAQVCPTDSGDYDYLNLASRQQRFGPSQFLHDFVA